MKSEYFLLMFFILAWQKKMIWTTPLDSISGQTWATPSALQNLWTLDRNCSPQKGWPTLPSLPEWVVLMTLRIWSRRGELNGINLNLRLYHPHLWSWGHVGNQSFRHASAFDVFHQPPQVLMPIISSCVNSFCEDSLGAHLWWSSSRRQVPVSALEALYLASHF